ncbi:MAG: hypothetical protein E7316_05910 [Clostridiales bacterium]|nr:hypothetical protein [Clostridiales bacterium]
MRIRLRIALVLLALLLIPCLTAAEPELTLSLDRLAAGGVVDFTLSGMEAEAYHYALHCNGQELFTSESPYAFGSYIPRKSGEYTLTVTAGNQSAQADFAVTEPMTCTLSELPESIAAGEPLRPEPQVTGGTWPYRYVYTITGPDGVSTSWDGGPYWHWVPTQEGEYLLKVTVSDSTGARAEAETAFTVTAGPGITLRDAGGALLAHGGQQSWTVYSPGAWTASTSDDFITLETSSGFSGTALCVTVKEPTVQPRRGSITIASGDARITWPVFQSAGYGVDEEYSLAPVASPLLADGQPHAVWLNAQGSRSFSITSEEAWHAESPSDYIRLDRAGDELTITVDPFIESARSSVIAIHGESSSAYIHVYQPANTSDSHLYAPSAPLPEEDAAGFTLYSQSSGYWKDQPYGKSTLEHSGCAIFALSHVLQRMGFEGEKITPEYLAANYSFALREGGTINATLVGNVGDDLGYKTRYELYESLPTIQQKLSEGAMFTFEVASGHIAAVVGQSEDGVMFHIVDSAPSATWERIKNAQFHHREADGSFTPITTLAELEGVRYYIENDAFGGAEYWLDASYVARRGVRLIQLRD